MDELKSGVITRDEYFEWKSTGRIPVMIVENMNLRNNGEKTFKTTNPKFKMDFRIFNL